MRKAFILGAGLGKRLRPLTERLPKPLVPLFHRPLAAWAVEACERCGIHDFAINTHHLPAAWHDFQTPSHLTFFHEPQLLETGGGLKNCASWMGEDPILVHNGDIFSTLPLERLIAAHAASGLPVTLALRSAGEARHIALDPSGTLVRDIREMLGTAPGTHLFTGIYCVNPEFLDLIPAHQSISVIPTFLQLAKRGKLGAIVLDEGVWMDLGDRRAYLQAHRELALGPAIHPTAEVADAALVEGSVIGPGARVEAGAVVKNSVVWPHSHVTHSARLDGCLVYTELPVEGTHRDADL